MEKYKTRRIIIIVVSFFAFAIAIAGLISIARMLFFSGGDTAQISASQSALISTTADRSVSLTVRGPIVADETFRSYQIKITPNERKLSVLKGYVGQEINSVKLTNNIPAYEQFVYAINKANMMRGTELTGDANDLRGICASGRVYTFQILKNNTTEKTLWTSSCSSARGSVKANLDSLTKLFDDQVPQFSKLTADLW